MPRKPNYKFARQERERAKAKKKADRLKAKAEQKAQKANPDSSEPETNDGLSPENPPDAPPVDDEIV